MKLDGIFAVFFAYASIVYATANSIGVIVSVVVHRGEVGLVEVLAPLAFIWPISCLLAFHVEAALSRRFLCELCLRQRRVA
jgi:hypothetical protein